MLLLLRLLLLLLLLLLPLLLSPLLQTWVFGLSCDSTVMVRTV